MRNDNVMKEVDELFSSDISNITEIDTKQDVEASEISYFTELSSKPCISPVSSITPIPTARPRSLSRLACGGAPSSADIATLPTWTAITTSFSVTDRDDHTTDSEEISNHPLNTPKTHSRKSDASNPSKPNKRTYRLSTSRRRSSVVEADDITPDDRTDSEEEKDELIHSSGNLKPRCSSPGPSRKRKRPKSSKKSQDASKRVRSVPNEILPLITLPVSVMSHDVSTLTEEPPITPEGLPISDIPPVPPLNVDPKRKLSNTKKKPYVILRPQRRNMAVSPKDQELEAEAPQDMRTSRKVEKPEGTSPAELIEAAGEYSELESTLKENRPFGHQPNVQPSLPSPSKGHSPSYTIVSRWKATSMTELIRRVNSLPGSPFPKTPAKMTAYSPYIKSSRSALSRIAPLHPNRRTPPPPPPKPPLPKKTKKQLEEEERQEEELSESVEGWACMTDEERAAIRLMSRRAFEYDSS